MKKDLSEANRAVNRLKQTEDVGILINAIPLVNLRTVPFSNALLDLDRPDGSTQGVFMVRSPTSELYQQGSAVIPPMSWSPHKVKRSVSASLAGEVFMMSEGLAECEWIIGLLESAVYQDYEPLLHRRKSIPLSVEPKVTVMKTDSCRPTRPQCASLMRKLLSILWYENRQEEHANTEGEVQMGNHMSRWFVDALTKRHGKQCYYVATAARWSPVKRG